MDKYGRTTEFPGLFDCVEMGGMCVAFFGAVLLALCAFLIGIVLSPVLIPYYVWRSRK